uniref:Uncharacterized protein n=1 Tax=Knipowitschia caucasica TaxID=637954 RepID=A0AAV2L4Y4_KNICA
MLPALQINPSGPGDAAAGDTVSAFDAFLSAHARVLEAQTDGRRAGCECSDELRVCRGGWRRFTPHTRASVLFLSPHPHGAFCGLLWSCPGAVVLKHWDLHWDLQYNAVVPLECSVMSS